MENGKSEVPKGELTQRVSTLKQMLYDAQNNNKTLVQGLIFIGGNTPEPECTKVNNKETIEPTTILEKLDFLRGQIEVLLSEQRQNLDKMSRLTGPL